MERDSFHRRNTAPAFPDWPDEVLLAEYVRTHDERHFRAIVKRHERMVLDVCGRVLHHWQDAENAAQRTWLVLLRKAASIRKGVSLKSWLHGVADRVARNLRESMKRRRKRVKLCDESAQPAQSAQSAQSAQPAQPAQPIDELAFREEQAVIDAELQRLPEEIRTCFILHRLERRSKREVAQALGLKEGTVASRVRRASKLLESRLAAYGILAPVKPNGKRFGVRRPQP